MGKTIHLTALALALGTPLPSVEAKDLQRLLFRIKKNSGFVPQELQYSLDCEVYDDLTVSNLSRGGGAIVGDIQATTYTAAISDGAKAAALIAGTERGTLRRTPAPTDAPTYKIEAVIPGEIVTKSILLRQRTWQSEDTNSAAATDDLVQLAEENCKNPTFE
jgi:hypothetical protein